MEEYNRPKTANVDDEKSTFDDEAEIVKPSDEPLPMPPKTPVPQLAGERRFDFDWRGTPLAQSIYAVAKIADKGVVINGALEGKVYLSLKQATCNMTLDYLSRAYNFNWMLDGNNIIISTSELMKQSEIFNVSYVDKSKLKDELKALGIDDSNIYANTQTNTVSITATPYQIQEARKRIRALDHPVAQCLLLAQLIEINHGKSLNLGMQYSLPTYSHTGSETNTTSSFKGHFLEKLTFSHKTVFGRCVCADKN